MLRIQKLIATITLAKGGKKERKTSKNK